MMLMNVPTTCQVAYRQEVPREQPWCRSGISESRIGNLCSREIWLSKKPHNFIGVFATKSSDLALVLKLRMSLSV